MTNLALRLKTSLSGLGLWIPAKWMLIMESLVNDIFTNFLTEVAHLSLPGELTKYAASESNFTWVFSGNNALVKFTTLK